MFRDFQAIRGPAGCGDDALSRAQQHHELAAVRDAALLVDVAHMSLEGALGDEQLLHDGRGRSCPEPPASGSRSPAG